MAGERHNFRQALWKWVEKNIILDLAWTQSHYLVKRLLLEWGQLLSTFGASSSTKLQECLWWAPGSAEAPDWLQQLKPWAGGVSVNSWMSSLQHWCLCGLENEKKRKKKKKCHFYQQKIAENYQWTAIMLPLTVVKRREESWFVFPQEFLSVIFGLWWSTGLAGQILPTLTNLLIIHET